MQKRAKDNFVQEIWWPVQHIWIYHEAVYGMGGGGGRGVEGEGASHLGRVRVHSFRRIQKLILILDLPDLMVERNVKSKVDLYIFGDLSQKLAICITASQEMTCFLLLDKLCDYTMPGGPCRILWWNLNPSRKKCMNPFSKRIRLWIKNLNLDLP